MLTQMRAKRLDIQALRALAVSLVVIYHIWPSVIPGGYVGVDIFFVISGFLITSHLLKEVVRTGTVSVTHFWARRIRRLLPASLTVLFASFIALLIWLPKSMWAQNLFEIAASALYVENWALAANSVDYLAAENAPSLVQHYWSLSVEEQFYLVWPLLILIVLAMSKKTKWIAVALAALLVFSLVFSVTETGRSEAPAYFVTPTRAWEFAAGSLLAFAPVIRWVRVRVVVQWLGLGLIGAAAFMLTAETPYPGSAALLPVVGAALLIWAGEADTPWAPSTIAPFGPIQLIGDLSYGIYLWHWPLTVLYPYVRGSGAELRGGLVILASSVVLAWLTKKFIEDPVRERRYWAQGRRRAYTLAASGMAATLVMTGGFLAVLEHGNRKAQAEALSQVVGGVPCFGAAAMETESECPEPFGVPQDLDPALARSDRGVLAMPCLGVADSTELRPCELGDVEGDVTIAVVGNSHAAALTSGLDAYAQEYGWRIETFLRQDCQGAVATQVAGFPTQSCLEWTGTAMDAIRADDEIDLVVFQSYMGSAPGEFTDAQRAELSASMIETWDSLHEAGKEVAVISDVPGTRPSNAPDCIGQHLKEYDPCSIPREEVAVSNVMFDAASTYEHASAVDITDLFCDADRCHAIIGGVVVYFDAHHLTATYSRTVSPYVVRELSKAMDK
jgi:peptidoglycan/LPS O-acetylase OafA/YrhL